MDDLWGRAIHEAHRAASLRYGATRKKFLASVCLVLGCLLALLLVALRSRPLLVSCNMLLVGLVGTFIATEGKGGWTWHDAQEYENRFWTSCAAFGTLAWLLSPDSPLRGLHEAWGLNCSLCAAGLVAMVVNVMDRIAHRRVLTKRPAMKKVASQHSFSGNEEALARSRQKLGAIEAALAGLDKTIIPSTLRNYFRRRKVLALERHLISTLSEATAEELCYIVARVSAGLLFYKVKDHSGKGRDHRSQLLELLCRSRLPHLDVAARAAVLHGMMLMNLGATARAEDWVRSVLTHTAEEDLTMLKNYCDTKGDIHSLHKLVYEDLRAPQARADVLAHLQRQGNVVKAHIMLGTTKGKVFGAQPWRKVLSDVDDTLFSSGGRYPAGCDSMYPRHMLYPGVTSFYRELDLGIEGSAAWDAGKRGDQGNLVFLSARPRVYHHKMEESSHKRFEAYRRAKLLHATPTMLAGSLESGRSFMMGEDFGPMAAKKFSNFREYMELYPEYKFVFIGDNGQADVAAAELMANAFKGRIEAVYIHQVKPIEETFGYEGPQTLAKWRRMGVHFFSTYVGAAVHAASVTTSSSSSSSSAAAGAACVGGVASSGGGGGGGCAEEGGASGGAIYDGGGQLRTAPLMYPQAVRRIALQAVAQCEHACAPGQQGGWEELRGRPVRSGTGGDTWQPWRARREMYARLLNRDVAAANALLAGARAAEAEASRGCAWFEAAGAAAMQRSLRPVRLAALPPMLSVGCAVCHRLTGQPAVVVAHGDIPSHSSEAKRHHRSFSMRLETASSTSSNTSLLRAAKGHREGAAGGLDDTTTTDTAEPLPSNRARRVESLVDGVQEVQEDGEDGEDEAGAAGDEAADADKEPGAHGAARGAAESSGRSNSDEDEDTGSPASRTPLIASANSEAAEEAAREEKHSTAAPVRCMRYELRLTGWVLAGGAGVTIFAPAEDVLVQGPHGSLRSSPKSPSRSPRSPVQPPCLPSSRSVSRSPPQMASQSQPTEPDTADQTPEN